MIRLRRDVSVYSFEKKKRKEKVNFSHEIFSSANLYLIGKKENVCTMNLHSINSMHFRFGSSKKCSATDASSIVTFGPSNSAIAEYIYVCVIHLVKKN